MARDITAPVQAALEARTLVARDFLWIVVRNRDTGEQVGDGMWSGLTTITAPVIDPDSGTSVTHPFYGAGGLVSISDIPAVSNITVQEVTIILSQVDNHVAELVRGYDAKQGRVEIFRGLFDPTTNLLIDPAECRFVGYIDEISITTPSENSEGSVTLTCVSSTQEMTRSNPDTRSDASQRRRSATDDFFADAAVVGDWVHFWGETQGTVGTAPSQQKQGLLGWGNFLGFL